MFDCLDVTTFFCLGIWVKRMFVRKGAILLHFSFQEAPPSLLQTFLLSEEGQFHVWRDKRQFPVKIPREIKEKEKKKLKNHVVKKGEEGAAAIKPRQLN